MNIFFERDGGNIFEWKDPIRTSLSFMQEIHKMTRFSADSHCYVLITVNCTLGRDLTPKASGNPEVYHIPYNLTTTYLSKSPALPVGWEQRSTQHHCWYPCSCLGYRAHVTKLRFEGISATPKHLCLFGSCILKVKSIGKWARSKFRYKLTLNFPCFSVNSNPAQP